MAMNPAVLTTARNAVVTRIMIFVTLSPFVEALGRATEGCPYFPSGRAVSTAVLISFAEHDFARHNILNERLTGIFTKSPDQVATPIAGSSICAPCILICVQLHSLSPLRRASARLGCAAYQQTKGGLGPSSARVASRSPKTGSHSSARRRHSRISSLRWAEISLRRGIVRSQRESAYALLEVRVPRSVCEPHQRLAKGRPFGK